MRTSGSTSFILSDKSCVLLREKEEEASWVRPVWWALLFMAHSCATVERVRGPWARQEHPKKGLCGLPVRCLGLGDGCLRNPRLPPFPLLFIPSPSHPLPFPPLLYLPSLLLLSLLPSFLLFTSLSSVLHTLPFPSLSSPPPHDQSHFPEPKQEGLLWFSLSL